MLNFLMYVNIPSELPYFSSSFLAVFAVLLSFFAIIFAFLKKIILKNKKIFLLFFIIIIFIIFSIFYFIINNTEVTKIKDKKIIVLAVDALDPGIVADLIEQGRLPNFEKIINKGSFYELSTVMPAQSPVVWASFITGTNPAKHGIFDFVRVDKNYKLNLSLTGIENPKTIKIGSKVFPVCGSKVVNNMKGKYFWEYLEENDIPSFVYFMPDTFPAKKNKNRLVAGMGIPDIYGNPGGSYSFYTNNRKVKDDLNDSGSSIIYCEGTEDITSYIKPLNKKTEKIPLSIKINDNSVHLQLQKNTFKLNKGQWSNWIIVNFNLGLFKKISGICQFYLVDTKPLKLYVSPINFNPLKPFFNISFPKKISKYLLSKNGKYYATLGMPYDTKALNDGVLDEEAFLVHAENVFKERKNIFLKEVNSFLKRKNQNSGLFLFYFSVLDAIQHVFFRYIDSEHPIYEDSIYKDVIYNYYEKIDNLLSPILDSLDKNTFLFIVSDHGFASFKRKFHLNTWLHKNGFLTLKDDESNKGREFFEDINWQETKAFAAGFNGIYINIKNKMAEGSVNLQRREEIIEELISKLENCIDPETKKKIINNIYKKEDLYKGPFLKDAPDLIIGYNKGYRVSWQTALGAVCEETIENQSQKWSGTHLIDSILVPGTFISSLKFKDQIMNIIDIPVSILHLFGIEKSKNMEGNKLFYNED